MTTRAWKVSRILNLDYLLNILIPRIDDIIFLSIFIAVLSLGPRLLNMDGDIGRHLTIGEYILDNLVIPTKDIFSFSMQGLELTPHEWLAQILFAMFHRIADMNGVVMLSALIIAVTFTLVFRQSYQRSNMLLVSLGMCILGAAAASVHWLARPHLFTMLFTVIWTGELESFRRIGRLRWWVLMVVMLAWVNIHGAFIAGFVIWGIYFLESLLTLMARISILNQNDIKSNFRAICSTPTVKLLMVGLISFFLTILNPVGWRIWETTLGFLQNRYLVSHTFEYLPPNFHQTNFWPFLIMIGGSILLLSLSIRKKSIAFGLMLAIWTMMGLISARNISLYAVIAAPILAEIASSFFRGNQQLLRIVDFDLRLRLVNSRLFGHFWPIAMVVVIGVAVINGAYLGITSEYNKFSEQVFPVKAIDWVSQQENLGSVFNYFPWGGYLLYRMWPQELVFIDGQTDFYGESLTRQYEQVITLSEGWREILNQYQISWVIMPAESNLIKALRDVPGWKERYADETAVIYSRIP